MSPDALSELFSAFGPVVVRRMFGGAGIYADGLMFALEADGAVYLKADESTVASFESEGSGPFAFSTKSGKRTVTSYWRLPDRLYDDVEELAVWARAAHGAAKRARLVKPPRSKRAGRIATGVKRRSRAGVKRP